MWIGGNCNDSKYILDRMKQFPELSYDEFIFYINAQIR